ncbi:MAG: tetratricopeptide repeat protein [Planctomycetes bacterium]|nr:tetratricopeptide repeat protein [Planctomycetota bacterium]
MRKPAVYLIIGISIVAVVTALLIALYVPGPRIESILALYQDNAEYNSLTIRYPLNKTLFPPEIVPPTFHWEDSNSKSDRWLLTIKFQDDNNRVNILLNEPQWTPESDQWEIIKKRSLEKKAVVTILGVNRWSRWKILSAGKISIKTSEDPVGAPLFYREVNLPFIDAVKDPTNIRWRFGDISSPQQPPIVLEKLPVCGNCHSFSANGETLAMDVDYANNKGSYVITEVAEEMLLRPSDIITWSDYRKEDGQQTFGLLSQISPDGRFVVSTVKDESVFVPKPELAFSQLFFPIKGILVIYDRQTGTFKALPGADDPRYVQSNPVWSPDGKYIVFARSEAYKLKNVSGPRKVLLSPEQCEEFLKEGKQFLFDLYRIPFNEGKGGKPEPIEGASNNGMSNYFAKYSPDSKWIVFCKAKSYMLLQPDSELYIIPAEGGKARKLRANTNRMNSWHSFSPNSKWLVFSSKANSAYTQLFLTHIDEEGCSSPAVLLSQFTAADRAANIPEFVNIKPAAIVKIQDQFVDDTSYLRAADEYLKADDFAGAERQCRKSLELNPKNAIANCTLGVSLARQGKVDEAIGYFSEAIKLEPGYVDAHYSLGQAMARKGKVNEAIRHFSAVLRFQPDHAEAHGYLGSLLLAGGMLKEATVHLSEAVRLDPNYADAHYNIGQIMLRQKQNDAAVRHLSHTVRLKPDDAQAHYQLALALVQQKQAGQALMHYNKAVSLKPEVDTSPLLHHFFATSYVEARRFREAALSEEKALKLARAAGYQKLVQEFTKRLEIYKQLANSSSK